MPIFGYRNRFQSFFRPRLINIIDLFPGIS